MLLIRCLMEGLSHFCKRAHVTKASFSHSSSAFQHFLKQHLASRSQMQSLQYPKLNKAVCSLRRIAHKVLGSYGKRWVLNLLQLLLLEYPYWIYIPLAFWGLKEHMHTCSRLYIWNIYSFMHISFLSLRETSLHLLSCSQDEASVKPLPRPGTHTILKRMLWHKQWSAKVITNYGPCGALAVCLLIMHTTAWLLHRKQTLLLAGLFCHIITVTGTGRIPGK